MESLPLLSILIFLPLIAAIFILLLAQTDTEARRIALLSSGAVFLLSLFMWVNFDSHNPNFQFEEYLPWFYGSKAAYHLGVDGISILFVVLAAFLTPLCIIASWQSIRTRVKEYMAAFLILETLMIGMFCALDVFLFYVFFEGVLIPMYLIIGVWGGDRRIYAAFKFFLYTLAGSVLMLVALIYMTLKSGTSSIPDLMAGGYFNFETQLWLWAAFFVSFAVKVPMWPVHTWLPDAHVQAPTAGSVILAGVLLKMGGYGFLRFNLPMLPEASIYLSEFMFVLSAIAVVYTSLVALVQSDMKKLIAYSSVAHMGFVTAGTFSFVHQGVQGAVIQMISHGVVSGALFLCVGVLYDRLHTKEIAKYGGVAKIMPKFAVLFMIFTLGSIGLPGTSGFIGEFLILTGLYQASTWATVFVALGVILGAAYMLWLYRRVMYGSVKKSVKDFPDLNAYEKAALIPLLLVVLWMGFYPRAFLNTTEVSVHHLLSPFQSSHFAELEGK